MGTTTASAVVPAPPAIVYRALLDPDAVAVWRVPDGMTAEVHELDARVGGRIHVSLTYVDPERAGKSHGATDTYAGRFVELVPGERVVEEVSFETGDPALGSPMTMTTTLRPVEGGTEVTIRHDGLPDGVAAADNEAGTAMALAKLGELVGLLG